MSKKPRVIEDKFWKSFIESGIKICGENVKVYMYSEPELNKDCVVFNINGEPCQYEKGDTLRGNLYRYIIMETFPKGRYIGSDNLIGLCRLIMATHELKEARRERDDYMRYPNYPKGYKIEIYERNKDNASLITLLPNETIIKKTLELHAW